MKAVVLVGGEGTRLRPLTSTTPKQLLPVVEWAMLERVLAHLAAHGIDEAVLSMGYRPDAFLEAYPDALAAGVRLHYAVEPEPLDTAGAIRFAADVIGVDTTFVVVNGDVLTDADTTALVAFHRDHEAAATIQLTPVEDPSRYGVVDLNEAGRVVAFVEKPPPGTAPTDLINAGTYVLEPAVLDQIPVGRRVSIERDTFPALVEQGSVYALSSDTYWLDAGTPESYLQANADLVGGVRRCETPAPGARLLGPGVWAIGDAHINGEVRPSSLVGDGATVCQGATVSSSVVGAGAVVGPGAVVDGSVLLAGAHIQAGSVVTRSIVGHGAIVGEGASVTELSVVGDGAMVAPGTILRDARVPMEAVN